MPKRTDIHKILVIGSGPIVIKPASILQFSLLKKAYLKNVMLKYSVLILTLLKERRTESFSKSFVKASANRFFRVRLQKILKTDLKLQEK